MCQQSNANVGQPVMIGGSMAAVVDMLDRIGITHKVVEWSRSMFRALAMGVLVVVAVAATAACRRAAKEGLTLAGSTSLQPFAEKWADAYDARRAGSHIHIQGGGSTAGIQAAISGAAQIGMSSRALTRDEAARVTGILVARDGMVVVVHPTNPVNDLTLDQVRAVYAGEIRNWRQLGARDVSITVITREEGSGTRAVFEELVMARHRILAAALVQDSTGGVRQMVASDPAAIGYVSLGLVDYSVKGLKVGGVAPGEATIDAGLYPLVRPFLFVVLPETGAIARDFIDWITGPEGRDLTRREGLLPPRA